MAKSSKLSLSQSPLRVQAKSRWNQEMSSKNKRSLNSTPQRTKETKEELVNYQKLNLIAVYEK